jgi:proliferating cell nuclear antigen
VSAIVRADRLAQFVDNAGALALEAKFHLDEDGLESAVVDPANVGMVEQSLAAAAFESYEFDGDVIGVGLERLDDVLGMADSDDLVHLELDASTRTLAIAVGGLEYTLALIDPDAIRQEPDVPDIGEELTATLVCEARELQHASTAADLCSDHIAFGAKPGSEVLYAEAQGDTDDVRYEWDREDTREGTTVTASAHSSYSLEYITDVLKPIAASTETVLQVGTDVPMFIESGFADGHGHRKYMIAPRTQS